MVFQPSFSLITSPGERLAVWGFIQDCYRALILLFGVLHGLLVTVNVTLAHGIGGGGCVGSDLAGNGGDVNGR